MKPQVYNPVALQHVLISPSFGTCGDKNTTVKTIRRPNNQFEINCTQSCTPEGRSYPERIPTINKQDVHFLNYWERSDEYNSVTLWGDGCEARTDFAIPTRRKRQTEVRI